jgi:hypothetical protein
MFVETAKMSTSKKKASKKSESEETMKAEEESPESTVVEKGKMNCWEFKKCGRQPGGEQAVAEGVCPAAVAEAFDGFHGGHNAGRACWAVAGTFCGNKPSGTFAKKVKGCTNCDFHEHIIREEADKYQSAALFLKKSKKKLREKLFKEPSFIEHVYAKSKRTAYEDDVEIESMFITFLIGWVSLCPSISMLQGSKRLCKDDLVDELMVIDAISDNPRSKAARIVFKTMLKAVRTQLGSYFGPLAAKTGALKSISSQKLKGISSQKPKKAH